jgi:hypothetical protein
MSVIRYHVPTGVPQGASPICWLACAIMIMQFKRGATSLSLSELGIDDHLDFRSSSVANPNNPEKGSNVLYAHHLRQLGFTLVRLNPRPRGCAPGDAAYVQWLLRRHGPLILNHFMGSFWYGADRRNIPKGVPKNPPGVPLGAHAVVITGWDSGRGRVFFNNPWGDMDVPTTESSIIGAIRRWETPQRFPLAYLP